jgi:hypothetical protein
VARLWSTTLPQQSVVTVADRYADFAEIGAVCGRQDTKSQAVRGSSPSSRRRDALAAAAPRPGIDHEKLTYRHNGSDRRLTDVHGHVIREILA